MLEVREGTLKGGLPYISVGHGPPLVVFAAGGPSNANPTTGWQRRYEARWLASLARGGSTVYRVNRKTGLKRGATSFADLADDYAVALEGEFAGRPVDVLGVSNGGMIAQQFAVDHPDLLRRLILAGAAYRLGPVARDAELRSAEFALLGPKRHRAKTLGGRLARLGAKVAAYTCGQQPNALLGRGRRAIWPICWFEQLRISGPGVPRQGCPLSRGCAWL